MFRSPLSQRLPLALFLSLSWPLEGYAEQTSSPLSGLNLQKLDTSTNLQLQVALNNATKDLPKGKGKKTSGRSNQPPSRTESDQQIRSSSKLHLQQLQQRTTTGPTHSTSSQRADTATATKLGKKSGFTLASPAVVSQNIEGEGDSDEWVSSESLSVTPQNQSSDSESGDEDDDVHILPANLNLTGVAQFSTSPDDREPPTPTVPQVRMQPPTPVNNVKEKQRHRLSISPIPNEAVGSSAAADGIGKHNGGRPIVSAMDDQESKRDHDHPHSDHRVRPEEGLASTPRPRVAIDRDTEPSRHSPPAPPSDPPTGPDLTARRPPSVNLSLRRDIQDQSQQRASSVRSARPHITSDESSGSKADHNPQGQDHILMTQQQHQQQPRPPTPTRLKKFPLSTPPSPTHRKDKARGDLSQAEQSGTAKRSGARPPSLYSLQPGKGDHPTVMTRPHPLIRGSSPMTGTPSHPNAINIGNSNGFAHQNGISTVAFGSGIGKLAPLTTITAAPSVSSSPPSSSPVSTKQKGKEEVEVKERLRRQSTASVSSVNTQRSLGRAAGYEYTDRGSGFRNPRERTLSTLSSSSYAALSALYPSYSQQSTPSQYSPKSPSAPPHTPGPVHGFTSYFPSTEGDNVPGPAASELMHMLLPAPYLSAHMTVLKGRGPIREAVERVSRARKAQSSQ